MLYIADTHAFMWYLTGDPKLGKKANDAFVEAEEGNAIIIVPTITLMEAMYITEKGRVEIEFKNVIEKMEGSSNFISHPLDMNIVKICEEVKTIPEIYDRIIVATAKYINAKILTKDSEIMSSKEAETVW